MNKYTIELERRKKHWAGWGTMSDKYCSNDSTAILDLLVEWSKQNPKLKIYRHSLYKREENIGLDGLVYDAKTKQYAHGCQMSYPPSNDIPFCDLVYYPDIYAQ